MDKDILCRLARWLWFAAAAEGTVQEQKSDDKEASWTSGFGTCQLAFHRAASHRRCQVLTNRVRLVPGAPQRGAVGACAPVVEMLYAKVLR